MRHAHGMAQSNKQRTAVVDVHRLENRETYVLKFFLLCAESSNLTFLPASSFYRQPRTWVWLVWTSHGWILLLNRTAILAGSGSHIGKGNSASWFLYIIYDIAPFFFFLGYSAML